MPMYFSARTFLLLTSFGFCGALAAQPLLVTTSEDSFDGVCDAHCSLREAIGQANASAGLTRIRLPAGDYRIGLLGTPDAAGYPQDEQDNRSGDFDIHGEVLIEGAGRDLTRIIGTAPAGLSWAWEPVPGAHGGRLFDVHPGARLGLVQLQLTGGLSIDDGGALRNRGEALLKGVDVHANHVLVPQGRGQAEAGQRPTGVGGAIANHGSLQLYDSFLVGNRLDAFEHSRTEGSALFNAGRLLMRDSAVAGNASAWIHQDFGGAALFNSGTADIARSWFSHNSSGEDGVFSLFNGGELKLSNSTLFLWQGIRNQRLDDQAPPASAQLIHVTSMGGVLNRDRMRVRNSLFAGAPDYFDDREPDDCLSAGPQADFQALGLVTSSPGRCPATAYEDFDQVFLRLLHPRDEGNAASFPRDSLAWARALAERGAYLRPRPGGLAVDAAIGNCAGHDQRGTARRRDGDGDAVAVCDLGAFER